MTNIRPASYPDVSLRAVEASDAEALYRVFTTSRQELLDAILGWDETQKESLLRMQFQAQQRQYRADFPDARFEAIVMDAQVIGNLFVAVGADEIILIDISLLADYRNRGIGQAILRDLLDQANQIDKPVILHVLDTNPAMRLYERLGFVATGTQGLHRCMRWLPLQPR